MIPLTSVGSKAEVPFAIGAPYHGTIVEGELDLTASGGPTITYSLGATNAFNLSLQNPNRTLPTRSSGQIIADAAVGKLYTDYALVPAGKIYGLGTLTRNQSVYFDSRGYTWLVDWNDLRTTKATDTLSGDVVFTRLFHIGDQVTTLTVTETMSETPAGMAGYPAFTGLSGGTTVALDDVLDQNKDGTKVILADGTGLDPHGLYLMEISDTIDESVSPYPYGGGTISFNIAFTVLKSRTDMWGAVSYTETGGFDVVDNNGVSLPGDPATTCINLGFGNPGGIFCAYDGTFLIEGEFLDRIIYANFNQAGTIVYWSIDLYVSKEKTYVFTGGGDGGTQTMDGTEEWVWTIALKKDGTQVDTKTVTVNRTYNGTSDTPDPLLAGSTVPSTLDSTVTATLTGFSNITGTLSVSRTDVDDGADINVDGDATWWASQHFIETTGQSLLTAAKNIAIDGEEPEAQLQLIDDDGTGTFSRSVGAFPELTASSVTEAFQIGIRNFRGNKTLGMYGFLGEYTVSSPDVILDERTLVLLDTVFSPDSSQAPDTTARGPVVSSDWGVPVAYDPENDAWEVSPWDATLGRWKRIYFV